MYLCASGQSRSRHRVGVCQMSMCNVIQQVICSKSSREIFDVFPSTTKNINHNFVILKLLVSVYNLLLQPKGCKCSQVAYGIYTDGVTKENRNFIPFRWYLLLITITKILTHIFWSRIDNIHHNISYFVLIYLDLYRSFTLMILCANGFTGRVIGHKTQTCLILEHPGIGLQSTFFLKKGIR